jgi:VCBS repeat-containing protein
MLIETILSRRGGKYLGSKMSLSTVNGALVPIGTPNASTTIVNNVAALMHALQSAHAGSTILLAPGTYSGVAISNFDAHGTVIIASQNAASPAIFTDLTVRNSAGLTFSKIALSSSGTTSTASMFTVSGSSNISFSNIQDHGSGPLGAEGLVFQNNTNISVTASQFTQLGGGITELNNSHVIISGNTFSQIGIDGIDNGGSSNVLISSNNLSNFEPTGVGHPDAIQFWTSNTTTAAQNIVVTGNTINQGVGGQVQGIFIQDEVGNIPFQNVTVSNNNIIGGLWNGIVVQGGVNVNVSGNMLTSVVSPSVVNPPMSAIYLENVLGGSLQNNMASGFVVYPNSSNISQLANHTNGYITAGGSSLSATAPIEFVNGYNVVAGTIGITDDASGNPTVTTSRSNAVAASGSTVTGSYGFLTIHPDGTFSYNASKGTGLTVGQTATDSFNTVITDSHGATTKVSLEFVVTGSATGNGTADTIKAGAGSETISGFGAGSTLASGTGPDAFVFNGVGSSTPAHFDTLSGFKLGDTINLTAVDPSFRIVSSLDHQPNELVVTNDGGGIWDIYGDTTGSGVANFHLHLTGVAANIDATNLVL